MWIILCMVKEGTDSMRMNGEGKASAVNETENTYIACISFRQSRAFTFMRKWCVLGEVAHVGWCGGVRCSGGGFICCKPDNEIERRQAEARADFNCV